MKLNALLIVAAFAAIDASNAIKLERANGQEFESIVSQLVQPNLSGAEECNVCLAACNLVDKELALASKTWSQIRDSVLERCDNINNQFVQSQCNQVMSKLDSIATLVEQKLEPNDVCYQTGFCKKELQAMTEIPKEICDDCEAVRFMASSSLVSAVKPMMHFYTPEMCHNFRNLAGKPIHGKSLELCKEYFNIVKDMLIKTLDFVEHQDGCNALLDCPATKQVYHTNFNIRGRHIATMPKFLCKACDRVNDILKNYLQQFVDNWPQVKEQVEKQCDSMGDKADMCKQGLEQLEEIVNTMKEQLPTLNICEQFDCKTGKALVTKTADPFVDFYRSNGRHLATAQENEDSFVCDSCNQGVEMINDATKQIKDQWPSIRSQLKQGCDSTFGVQGPASAVCEKVLVALDGVIPDLDKYLEPVTGICDKIGCENKPVISEIQAIDMEEVVEFEEMPEVVCEACDKAEEFVHRIGSKAQEQWPAIRDQVAASCDNLEVDSLVTACNQGLAKVDEVIKQIDEKLLNANVCEPLGCESSTVAPVAFDAVEVYSSANAAPKVACEACEFGVNLLQGVVDALEEQWPTYRDDLVKKCANVGDSNLVAMCKDGVQDLDMIVSALKDQIAGLNLCEELDCEPTAVVE